MQSWNVIRWQPLSKSTTLDRPPEELEAWMGQLIVEWKRQAAGVLTRFGYTANW
jgi:hypothetical protein